MSPKLLKAYEKLSDPYKALLSLMALAYFKVPTENLRSCFLKFPHVDSVDPKMGFAEFMMLVKNLKSQGFLDQYGYVQKELRHFLTVEALNSKHAKQYLDTLKSEQLKKKNKFYSHHSPSEELFCALRLSIYENDEKAFIELARQISPDSMFNFFTDLFLEEDMDLAWLEKRFIEIQQLILHLKLHTFCEYGKIPDQIPGLLAHYLPLRDKPAYKNFNHALLFYDVLSVNIKWADQTLLLNQGSPYNLEMHGLVHFLTQENANAISNFENSLKLLRKTTGKNNVSMHILGTSCYILALLKTQDRNSYKKIQTVLDKAKKEGDLYIIAEALQNVLWKLQGLTANKTNDDLLRHAKLPPVTIAILALTDYWIDKDRFNRTEYKKHFLRVKDTLPLIGYILAEILHDLDPNIKEYGDYLQAGKFTGIVSFINCIQIADPWKIALSNLDHFFDYKSSDVSSAKRLVWYFNPSNASVSVVEQNAQKKGWSKGRAVSLQRFQDKDPDLNYLTDADQKVIKTLRVENSYGWGGRSTYGWDPEQTPLALIGHPCVYHATNVDVPITLVEGKLELVIKELDNKDFHVSLSHVATGPKIFVEKETPSRYRLIHFSKAMLPLVEILGAKGLKVPANAKDHIVSIVQKAGPHLAIHSDVDALDIPAQAGDPTPCLQLRPLGDGLSINLLVRPFGDHGPYFRPGTGKASVHLFSNAQNLRAKRSLDEERTIADSLIEACPHLKSIDEGNDEWIVDDVQSCLEILAELQELTQPHKIEWPEGQKLSITKSSSFGNLSLKIQKDREWFNVGGSLQVDEGTVMDFNRLLDLLDASGGRFIPLEDNKFMALNNHFKKQLQDLKALMDQTKDGARVHALGSHALKIFTDQVSQIESDAAWKKKLKDFKDADKYQPQLPVTLQADLREYQKAGFEWISRLFHLGAGACLADDMGLGKTVQAIAVLLNQAPQGPCLVVAPTSVCHNWATEIARFAPTLSVHTFENAKRADLVGALKEMDVLVCSYTVLQQEMELLAGKHWQMIILDEAQSIKNSTTRRFQAAVKLQGTHKLALTGTPIENSLEEIWSLFQFINPGLLRSQEDFRKRFLIPIEREKNMAKRTGLKNLIQMFILRRTKNMVLPELPSRTEQTILVEMDPEEIAFYEALRRQALDNISNLSAKEGQRKIHILAEITRLRRACCHSSLAQKDITVASSKLKVFLELVTEVLQNNHQVLVFSQYVGFLSIVRQALDEKGLAYQYLDGSTPALERRKQVQDFQEGKSSIFLLSLKAGGTGLNLTAADYVIHLDPWWNPAVEDQASDRAHRLGQKRPVTIYRLIVQNTIEEKILKLHADKRTIAEDLLDGSHTAGKMSEEDLIQLMGI